MHVILTVPTLGRGEEQAFGCSSLHLPQSLQSQRRSSSVRQLHFPALQFFLQLLILQLHPALSSISPDPGLLALLGLCPLPHSAQRRAWASPLGSGLGTEPPQSRSVCEQHTNGPFGGDISGSAGAAAPWSHRHQTVRGRKLLVELLLII